MKRPMVLIVTGQAATGKTALSQKIGSRFCLPCLSKDAIKERLADVLGVEDLEVSRKLGKAAYEVLDYTIESLLKAGSSFVMETNFSAEFYSEKINRLRKTYSFDTLQILCWADPEEIIRRATERIRVKERHPVHGERWDLESGVFRQRLGNGRLEPLDIGGTLIELDTTNFSTVDYETLFQHICMNLKTNKAHFRNTE